jgi:hypothetical protein
MYQCDLQCGWVPRPAPFERKLDELGCLSHDTPGRWCQLIAFLEIQQDSWAQEIEYRREGI